MCLKYINHSRGLIEDLRYLNLQVYIIALNNMGHCQQYFGLKPTNHERRLFYIIQRQPQFYY